MIDILLSALLLSLVLLSIHAYFGIEIIRRGIIFTDLAISQMSALGVAISILLQIEYYSYAMSVGFAIFTAILVAIVCQWLKGSSSNIQEAFIGLLYVLGVSGCYVVLSKTPHGMEVFQRLLATDILYNSFGQIVEVAVLYLFIGLIIYLSRGLKEGYTRDLIFFISFAVTVTSSVKMAGVLVVFTLLVAPALMSITLKVKGTFLTAWLIGASLNSLAIVMSYQFDLPTGYTIVALNALSALLFVISRFKLLKS